MVKTQYNGMCADYQLPSLPKRKERSYAHITPSKKNGVSYRRNYMEQISTLFPKIYKGGKIEKKKKSTERGDLFEFFISRLNPQRKKDGYGEISYSRMGYLLQGVETKDLYALKSKCEDAERRGYSFSKCFFGCLK